MRPLFITLLGELRSHESLLCTAVLSSSLIYPLQERSKAGSRKQVEHTLQKYFRKFGK
jgi:hypothetical protein